VTDLPRPALSGKERLSIGGRCDIELDCRAGIARQLHAVLLAVEFIGDVVAHYPIFKDVLGAAVLHGLGLRGGRAFDVVAQNGPAKDAQHGGCRFTATAADLIAQHAPSDGPHRRARTAFVGLHRHLLLCAHLAWHSHLLNDLDGREDFADFLGAGQRAQAQQGQSGDDFFHEGPHNNCNARMLHETNKNHIFAR